MEHSKDSKIKSSGQVMGYKPSVVSIVLFSFKTANFYCIADTESTRLEGVLVMTR